MERLLFEVAVRAALIAGGTAFVLRILRVRMAAARHAAWAGVVIAMMLLPVWTAWGPKASWRVLPAAAARPSADPAMLPVAPFPEATSTGPGAIPAPARQPARSWRMVMLGIYLLGVCVLLARLALGTVRARMVVRRAANRGGRLTSDSCAAPITVGWLTPAVILPRGWQQWPQAQLDAVLAHEGEHARRRDPLVQWLALLNRAIFWFHPLAWWLERRLSALAEEACDAAVVARGCDPFEYAEYLLEMARRVVQTGVRVKVLGMAMPGSSLPRRIRRILERRPAQRLSRMRMVCVGAACALLSAVFAAGAVDRQATKQPPAPAVVTVQALPALAPSAPAPMARRVLLAQARPTPVPAPQTPAAAKLEDKYKDRRLLVLYFDLQGMPALDRQRAFGAAEEYVRRMQASDLVAVITAHDEVKVNQDFTGDRDQLLKTLDGLTTDSGQENGGAADANRQLTNLHTAVNMLGSLPGKKAVMYFAAPIDRGDSLELKSLIDAAIRANVAFYSVDPRGLVSPLSAAAADAYMIGAGDVLRIWVAEQPNLPSSYTVRQDGVISLPLAGNIKAAGLTTAQLQAVIADRLEANQILEHPTVTVGMAEPRRR